ncbi:catalase-related domain-containing protein [Marihabitans asiaticum]|uniref:catalase-related domain-containing protein n=2 Tax=Marihabitans asiaticum TaxID=415218 RepID=UPI0031CE7092
MPNSFGRPHADEEGPVPTGWEADGEMVRSVYELHPEDDDFSQPGALVREVFDDAARERLVATVAGTLDDVVEPVLSNVFTYWSNIDEQIGQRIKAAYDEAKGASNPGGEPEDAKDEQDVIKE